MKYVGHIICFLAFACGCAGLWVALDFGRISVPQLLINLTKFNHGGSGVYCRFALYVVLPATLLTFLPTKIRRPAAVAAAMAGIYLFNIIPWLLHKNIYSDLYEKEYVAVYPESVREPLNRQNLVVLYLESMEKQYGDPAFVGNALTPKLTDIRQNATSFADYVHMPANGYTISALVAGQCGLNMEPLPQKIGGEPLFVPQATCLSDILSHHGYRTYFLKSADMEFTNTGFFARQHNFAVIKGEKEWYRDFADDREKIAGNSWGVRDSFLYDRAKDIIAEESRKNNAFALFMITVDTHDKSGYVDPLCGKRESSFANTIRCADKLAADFIDWCQKQPFADRLTIVVVGDHIAHGRSNPVYTSQPPAREIENIFINPLKQAGSDHRWTTFDLAPTILEAIGYDMPALGLGRSLFRPAQTLYEKYGNKLNVLTEQKSHLLEKLNTGEQTAPKKYADLKTNRTYNAEDLSKIADLTPVAQYAFNKLWLSEINFRLPEKTARPVVVKIVAAALPNTKAERVFDVRANGATVGKISFPPQKSEPVTAEFAISAPKNGKTEFSLVFANDDFQHWAQTVLGIGVQQLEISLIDKNN